MSRMDEWKSWKCGSVWISRREELGVWKCVNESDGSMDESDGRVEELGVWKCVDELDESDGSMEECGRVGSVWISRMEELEV